MDDSLAQMILVAQGDDAKGWMNILVVVVLAVFWVVGGIIKAKTQKSQAEDEEQSPPKPARKPQATGASLREQFLQEVRRLAGPTDAERPPSRPGVQQPRARVAGPSPAIRKPAHPAKQAVPAPGIRPIAQKPPKLEVGFQELPEFTSETVKALEPKRVSLPGEMPEVQYLSEILLDYADPDELKRAILHYEILGKPLSLRGPSGIF